MSTCVAPTIQDPEAKNPTRTWIPVLFRRVVPILLACNNNYIVIRMAPRGLSAEDKRVRLLEIFHETKDFFQLKELEKIGPKMKGIVSQSVKEVLQGLVDDGMVQADKIGSSNFFWSFPSQRGAMMQSRLATVKESQASYRGQLTELRAAIEAERAARPDSVCPPNMILMEAAVIMVFYPFQEDRRAALARLASFRKEFSELEAELAQYGACDPIRVEEKKRAVVLAKEAASIPPAHFTRQSCVEPAEIKKYLGVDDEYEDIC
ncbi:uncharacterized protein FIBRA_07677 [Fibroporia radiculosa]|uniref:Mnd1 HTH domain-containing protein n=1 Tax=Fibroporia radiculosa TaxID=599839 RepID=J4I143_9APHY|nr:uncharacterized protein FIBRA_07677 [Fibroporia radiculosa]CCM05457.1 predicted protein [Fibroporia radiculosa]